MTFFWSLLVFVAVATGQVLDRIETTPLSYFDEVCGNLTTLAPTLVDGCATLDLGVAKAPCIAATVANCLVRGLKTDFTNFTSDDVEVPFRWLCAADNQCGIVTLDTNSTGGILGALNGSTTFGATHRVVGFLEAGASAQRQVRRVAGGVAAIDKRVEYVFSFDFCFANATSTGQSVTLKIDIANETALILADIVPLTTVTVPANAAQSTCGRALVRVPHYALFPHVGINGFAVTVGNTGSVRVFLDNFLVQALPVISNDEGDTCQFAPAVVNTVAPAGTPTCTRVFINEINYRNVTFTGMQITPTEAIEIAGPAGTDLSDMKVVLVNFDANGVPQQTPIVMGAQAGSVVIPESAEAPGFGFVTVAFSQGLPDGADGIGIDGVALFQRKTDAAPIQFVCFGTNASAANLPLLPFPCSTVVDLNGLAVNDTSDPGSVSLIGCGNCYQDFDWGFTDPATIVNATAGLPFQNAGQQFCRDQDADGFWDAQCCNGNDCNDLLSFVFPGAAEICDGLQTNCIGPAVSELDADGDGRLACDGDCNDADNTTFGLARFVVNGSIAAVASNCRVVPLAVNNSQLEQCDLVDNDCDGLVNEAFVSVFHFRDNDFDGFADVNADDRDTAEFPNCQVFQGCEVTFPRGWSPNRTDCDDTNANVHPDGNVFCRINDTCEDATFLAPVDNNCNGLLDEFDVIDRDGDGFANATASANATSCPLRAEAFANGGDCNDAVFAINPNATEVCNKLDDDCDLLIDEDLFIDLDGDGFGNRTASHPNCTAFYNLNDCDDRNDTTLAGGPVGNFSHPGLVEVLCDGLDNDCNAATPDSRAETCDLIDTDCNCGLYNDPMVVFVSTCDVDNNVTRFDNGIVNDTDGDEAYVFGAAFRTQCLAAGYVFDCNDTDVAFPGAEQCDGLDNDCDGLVDEDFFVDSDGDLWPNADVNATLCGSLYNLTADCAPFNAAINPGVDELASDALFCNNFDDDCNNQTGPGSLGGAGALEENSTAAILFDADGDGFRNLTDVGARCSALVLFDAFLNQPLDCDDQDPARHPCSVAEFVCLTRIGGVHAPPCGADEHRVCGRELTVVDGLITADGIDNDCNEKVDDLVEFAVHFILAGEFFDAAEATDDDDDSSSSSSSSSSSLSKPDQFCADIKATIRNNSTRDIKDIVIKGQLTLPPKGQLTEYVFGDLTNFGVKVDTRTLRVAWVQFKLAANAVQEVVFPVCVRRREYIGGVQLALHLEDYSLDGEFAPEPLNVQTTIVNSNVTIVAFP